MNAPRLRSCAAIVVGAGVVAALLAGCSSDSGSSVASDCKPKHENIQTISPGKLTIGVIDIPPFSSYNSGNPEGIDISIVNRIAKEDCLQPVYQQATYADAVQSISTGTIDMALGTIDATEKRMTAVDFSSSTYLDGMGIASKSGAKTVSDLEKVGTVGTIEGYLWVEDLRKILGDKLKTYPSSVELKADFDAGRLGADVDAYGVLVPQFKDVKDVQVFLANEHPDPRVQAIVQAPEAAFPYTKGNTSLGKALSDGIEAQRQDGTVTKLITDAGLSPKLAEVGQKQYVVPASG
jgi:polar amino acid transport system substrate-binding protein